MENEFEHDMVFLTSLTSGHSMQVVDDVICLPTKIVNVATRDLQN